jgi:hypothetical protein
MCDHRVTESRVLRLCLSHDAENIDAVAATLASFIECPNCSAGVILELISLCCAALNDAPGDWKTAMAERLSIILDDMADSDHQ